MRDDKLEKSLIGALILHPEWSDDVVGICASGDFAGRGHSLMWEAVAAAAERGEINPNGKVIDIAEVERRLRVNGGYKLLGGLESFSAFTDGGYSVITRDRAVKYATEIRRMAQVRRFGEAAAELAEDARKLEDDPLGFLERAETRLVPLTRGEVESPRMLMGQMVGIVESMFEGRERGVPSGFGELDRYTLGLPRSGLTILGARPSMGKSALAAALAMNVAESGAPVLFFSLEMPRAQLVMRMISAVSGVPLQALRKGRSLTPRERGEIHRAAIWIEKLPIAIDDTSDLTVSQIRVRSRAFHREHCRTPIGDEPMDCLIVVDYLQLLTVAESTGSRDQDVGAQSKGLKKLARELKCPVLALSQLNRKVDDRSPPRPHLGDLRESGNIEQDGDLCLFVWRPEKYDPNTKRPGTAEVIIGKQRNGPTGACWLGYDGDHTRFHNLDRDPPDEAAQPRSRPKKLRPPPGPPENVPPPED